MSYMPQSYSKPIFLNPLTLCLCSYFFPSLAKVILSGQGYMGFVVGCGNIDVTTAPPYLFLYCIVYTFTRFMGATI